MAERQFVNDGDIVRLKLPYTEVCMHMRVAGKTMNVMFIEKKVRDYVSHCAQIFSEDGNLFSFPILASEAGFYHSPAQNSWYCLPEIDGEKEETGG